MKIQILGQVRLQMHGKAAAVSSTKVRGLLGYLAYRVNESVHVDRIAAALWDAGTSDPAKVLQPYVSRARRVLRESGHPAVIVREHRSYRLEVDPADVDYHEFVATVRTGHRARGRGDVDKAAQLFARALQLWVEPPLADLNTTWAERLRETLTNQALIPAHCALFDTKLDLGDHEFVLTGLPPLLADYPHDERLAVRWVRALTAANRSGEVPPFFREFSQRLLDDLDAKPSSELLQIVTESTTKPHASAHVSEKPGPPRATPYFTGRDALLEVLDLLVAAGDRDVDVVALDGPPGVGKTTLAKQWARRHRDTFRDGVLYADMAAYSNAPLIEAHAVMAGFLEELGFNSSQIPNDPAERAGLLRHSLSTRDILIVYDNVRDSAHVRPLLAATSTCATIVTSRRQLSGLAYHDGVHRMVVPVLTDEDAAALLTNRIGERATADPAAVTKLVALCKGLPLALRIAGEHIASRPTAPINELATELESTKRLLDAGSHGDDDTTTLRSTISWSYHALRAEEQRLFRAIGVHPGPRFSAAAARALIGETTSKAEYLLDSLVGAHLVTQEGAGRYLTHDLLHGFAAAAAEEHEAPDLRDRTTRRMLDWYLGSARHARTHLVGDDQDVPDLPAADPVELMSFSDSDSALHWLIAEHANLVACTYMAADLGYHGHAWRFSACLHVLSRYESPHALLDIHELGRRSAELAGDTAAEAGCLNNKGTIAAMLNDHASAGKLFEMAYQKFTEAEDTRGIAVTTHNSGAALLRLGRPAEALTWLTKGLALNTRLASEWAIANSHRSLGDAHTMLNDLAQAQDEYRQASYASQKAGDIAGHGASLARLADLALTQDRLAEAIRYGEAALDVLDRAQVDRGATAATLCTLATAHLRCDAPAKSIPLAEEAIHTSHETRNISGEIDGLILLGQALTASGEPARAANAWTKASELLSSPDDPRGDTIRTLLQATGQEVPSPRTDATPGIPARSRSGISPITR